MPLTEEDDRHNYGGWELWLVREFAFDLKTKKFVIYKGGYFNPWTIYSLDMDLLQNLAWGFDPDPFLHDISLHSKNLVLLRDN